MKNATFISRAAAYFIDAVILFPIGFFELIAGHFSLGLLVVIRTLVIPAWFIYNFYFISLRGQTIGKRVMKIKVVKRNGEAVGQRAALYRGSIDLILAIAGGVAFVLNALPMLNGPLEGGVEFSVLPFLNQMEVINSISTTGLAVYINYLTYAYMLADIISFYVTNENRVIHDLIAGTRVIQVLPETTAEPITEPASEPDVETEKLLD